jgi:hypothetical protein
MSKKIAEYFLAELISWEQSFEFYKEEIGNLGIQLEEIIQRNSIVDIAAKVEAHQILLNEILDRFNKISVEIYKQKQKIQPISDVIADSDLSDQIRFQQDDVRALVQNAEKDYIDVKYFCYEFLSETLNK